MQPPGLYAAQVLRSDDTVHRVRAAGLDVFVRSVAGKLTSTTVKAERLHVAFDVGCVYKESVGAAHVFVTHCHYDHVSALLHHAFRHSAPRRASLRRAAALTPPRRSGHEGQGVHVLRAR